MASVGSSTSSTTLQISGLVSGLDTASLIDSLISVEGTQKTLLQTKRATATSASSALKSLNTKVASLAAAARSATQATSWGASTGTSSADHVSVKTTSAVAGRVSFTVDKVARAQSSLMDLPTDVAAGSTFTLTRPDASTTTVTLASGSMADVLAAFNSSDAGVTAAAINVGDSTTPVYKLQLTSSKTGTAAAFGLSYTGTSGTPTSPTLAPLTTASDAQVTLFPGTTSAVALTRPSNTFTNLMSGVDVTVSKESTDPVTVTVAPDDAARTTLAKNLVSNLNLVLGEITDRTKATTSTASDGGTVVKGGVLSANSGVRGVQGAIQALAGGVYGGSTLASVGISIDKSGTWALDEAALSSAMAADPQKVQRVLTSFAKATQAAAEAASDPVSGTLTLEVKQQDAIATDLGTRIDSWDDRLAMRRTTLEKQYAALEVSLQRMQSQSSWLSSQLANLSTSS